MQRVVTGVVLVALLLVLVFVASSEVFKAAVVFVSVFGAAEWARIARRIAPSPSLWVLPVLAPAMAAWLWGDLPLGEHGAWIWLATLGAFAGTVALLTSRGGSTGRDPRQAPAAAAQIAWGTAYLGTSAAAMVRLHEIDRWLFFLVVLTVAASDTAAYYGGRATGRHKLAPAVSPNKTVEGSAWGLAFAVLLVGVFGYVWLGRLEPWLLVLGAVTAIAGQIGDLVESLLKRAAGVKDSGRILPGHGGILDRVDALLLAAPVFYIGLLVLGVDRFLPAT